MPDFIVSSDLRGKTPRTPIFFSRFCVSVALLLLLSVHSTAQLKCGYYDTAKPMKKEANESVNEFVNRMMSFYDGLTRPHFSDTAQEITHIHVSMFVLSISSLNIVDMEYSLEIDFRQHWNEPRLQFTGYDGELHLHYQRDSLWLPDVYFKNAKSVKVHQLLHPNMMIRVQSNGNMVFSQKLSLRLACTMKLAQFPVDLQICSISEIGSYSYTNNHISYRWLHSPHHEAKQVSDNVAIDQSLILNEYDLPKVGTHEIDTHSITGNYSVLRVDFYFQRKIGFYIIYTYLPSFLIVTLSWLSFFIDCSAVPARISLGLLSVLSLLTQTTVILQKLPRVSYIKAIDVWLFTCLAFVGSSTLEFIFVYVLERARQARKKRAVKKRGGPQVQGGGNESSGEMRKCRCRVKPQNIDLAFVFAYPLAFTLFVFVYWSYYLQSASF